MILAAIAGTGNLFAFALRIGRARLRSGTRPVTVGCTRRVDRSSLLTSPTFTEVRRMSSTASSTIPSMPSQNSDPTAKLWSPSPQHQTGTDRFRHRVQSKLTNSNPNQKQLSTYEDLWKWSTQNVSEFWNEVWDATEVVGDKGPDGAVSILSLEPSYPVLPIPSFMGCACP